MSSYHLLITEITSFGDLRCVAGWDVVRGKMIRPEPHPGGFWPAIRTGTRGAFDVGKSVRLEASKPSPPTKYPHFTEDRVVVVGTVADGPEIQNPKAIIQKAAFNSLSELFDENLIFDGQKAYVPVGAKCRSLGGLIVPSAGVSVESYRNYGGKQRLRLRFRADGRYLAPNLTSTKAYETFSKGKIDEANRAIGASSKLLLRIGLARGFSAVPDRCYLQVNGLTTLPKDIA